MTKVGLSSQKELIPVLSLSPDLPGGRTPVPELVEQLVLAVCVHREEGPFVSIDHQLALSRQAFQRLAFEDAIVSAEVARTLFD